MKSDIHFVRNPEKKITGETDGGCIMDCHARYLGILAFPPKTVSLFFPISIPLKIINDKLRMDDGANILMSEHIFMSICKSRFA